MSVLQLKIRPSRLHLTGAVASAFLIGAVPASAEGGGGGSLPGASAPAYDPTADYQAGSTAFQRGDYSNAIESFRRVVRAIPRNAQAQYLLGASYMGVGDFRRARRPLQAAVNRDEAMIVARRDLGITLARLGEAEPAQEQIAALTAQLTDCGTCASANALNAAIEGVQSALATGPHARGPVDPDLRLAAPAHGDNVYVAAVSLINEGRYEPAIALLNSSMWATGPHPDILTYLGYSYRRMGQIDRARDYYEQALAVAPHHRGALEYYGELKLEQGDVAGARAHLARLDTLCSFGCHEADELRRWIGARSGG